MVIERIVNPFGDPFDAYKFFIELVGLIISIILLYIFISSSKRNPILKGKGGNEFTIAFVMIVILYVMEVIDNFIWFDSTFFKLVWKPIKQFLGIATVSFLLFGFYKVYRFSDVLFRKLREV